jgi:hypothetical protein
MAKTKVFIGLPNYGSFLPKLHFALQNTSRVLTPTIKFCGSSFLTKNFNILWSMALNARKEGITHFVLHHADVLPEYFWLDKMLAVMEREKADVVSAVIPIKTPDGITSTAMDKSTGNNEDPEDNYLVTRLSLKQCYKMTPTFTHEKLLINTGLMLVDFRKDWIEKVRFHFENEIVFKNGEFKAVSFPEDWLFSRHAKALGAKLVATREVVVEHVGEWAYSNAAPWGNETDTKA